VLHTQRERVLHPIKRPKGGGRNNVGRWNNNNDADKWNNNNDAV